MNFLCRQLSVTNINATGLWHMLQLEPRLPTTDATKLSMKKHTSVERQCLLKPLVCCRLSISGPCGMAINSQERQIAIHVLLMQVHIVRNQGLEASLGVCNACLRVLQCIPQGFTMHSAQHVWNGLASQECVQMSVSSFQPVFAASDTPL